MKMIKTMITSVIFMMLCTIPSFAAVTSVTVDIKPDVTELAPGEFISDAEPVVNSNTYSIYEYHTGTGSREEMKAYKYTITLTPTANNEFDKNNMTVRVNGVSKVTIETLTASQLKIVATTYPYYRLRNVREVEDDGDGYSWKKSSYAKKYNVVMWYEDDNGNNKQYNTSVTTNHVSVRDDWYVDHVAVQAIPGSSDEEWKYLIPSEYVNNDGEVETEVSNAIKSFSYPSATATKKKNNNSSSNKSSNSGSANGPQFGWINSPSGTWFKNPDGTWPANQWMMQNNKWYFFDQNGYLVKNQWLLWNGEYYCLDKDGVMYSNRWTPDGFYVDQNGVWDKAKSFDNAKNQQTTTQTQVQAGWRQNQIGTWYQNPDGTWPANQWLKLDNKWYYFNQDGYLIRNAWLLSGNVYYYVGEDGAMYANRYTPDGYYVDGNGAWRP